MATSIRYLAVEDFQLTAMQKKSKNKNKKKKKKQEKKYRGLVFQWASFFFVLVKVFLF